MTVDFHVHFSGGKYFYNVPSDVNEYIRDMDQNRISISALLPMDGFFSNWQEDNDRIARIVRQYPDRFVGMGTVNPRMLDEAMLEMKRCLDELDMIGMKFHPWVQAFSPLEDHMMSLAEEANQMKTMFFYHDGTPPYTEPYQIAEVARRNPDLTIVMGHTGLNDLWRESLLAAQKYDNIWLCFCACPFWGMKETVQAMNGERIIWGSDYPLANVRDTRDRLRQVELLPVSDQIKEKVFTTNAEQLIDMLRERRNHRSGA